MSTDSYSDIIQPFLIDHSTIRGRMVRLEQVLETILHAHHYPPLVSLYLAEQIVIAAMLAATLDKDGILTVQTKGNGAISFMVVDVLAGGIIRGYANVDETKLQQVLAQSHSPSMMDIMGKGYLAVTLDEGGSKDRYQGIVELEGKTLSDVFKGYFLQSHQAEVALHTVIRAPDTSHKHWTAGGIIIERMPIEGGKKLDITPEEHEEIWQRSKMFMDTLKDSEVLSPDITPQNLLYRLFNEDGVWVYKIQQLKSGCRCSRKRIRAVLKTIPKPDLIESLKEGKMSVNCQFCNRKELFTRADVNRLYALSRKKTD